VVKCNPDAPQLPLRILALRQGKRLFMAVPRLRQERCFLELDPRRLTGRERAAASIRGAAQFGKPTLPKDMPKIDLIVTPDDTTACPRRHQRPPGILWSALPAEKIADIPVVARLARAAVTR
jgi:hypothetical protein